VILVNDQQPAQAAGDALPEDRAQLLRRLEREVAGRRSAEAALRQSEARYQALFGASGDGVLLLEDGVFVDCNPAALEMALANEAEWRRALIDNSRDGIAVFGADHRILEANPRFEEMLGYAPGGVLGLASWELDAHQSEAQIRSAFADPLSVSVLFETHHRCRDGRLLEVEVSANGARIGGREVFVTVNRDITQRKAGQRALQEREALLAAIFDQAAVGIDLVDLETLRFVRFNRASHTLLGYTAEEFARLRLPDIQALSPDAFAPVFAANLDRLRVAGALTLELPHRCRDGSLIEALLSLRLMELAGREHILAVWTDISERQRALTALRDREELYRTLVNQAGEAIDLVDAETLCFVEVGEAACRLLGYPREELLGRSLAAIQAELSPDRLRTLCDRLLRDGGGCFEARHRCRDGRILDVQVTVRPVELQGRRYLLGIWRDVTEQRQAKQELEQYRLHLEELVARRTRELARAKEQAEAASVAKTAFLANMSHEIRTPLNAITGMAYLIRRDGLSPQQAERLDKLEAASAHLLDTLSAVLELSRIEAGKLELAELPLQPAALAAEILAMLQEQARVKGLRLTSELEALPANLLGDPTRLRQALLNYLSNAIKFTRAGQVTLGIRVQAEEAATVRLHCEVRDTGIGIPAAVLPRLFTAFEQADNSLTRDYGGSGLGLAITRKIVERMGGEVGVHSTPGTGSTFWFTVPLKRAPAAAPGPPAAAVDAALTTLETDHPGRRILLAEDDPANQQITQALLELVGLVVEVAPDGDTALALAGERQYDLILMDIRMPGMNGLDAARAIRRLPNQAGTPIVAMTANAFTRDREQCLAAGMNDFLSKPVRAGTLYTRVLHWLQPVSGS
jgi:two-component system sensor histidine kinase/response regulator